CAKLGEGSTTFEVW
nr:immunoglobulin heavy chain junction region [Macaca mulatta]